MSRIEELRISGLRLQLLDLSLPTPEENLALDEALLDEAESLGSESRETLRLWTPASYAVVVGRNSKVSEEVNEGYCNQQQIPILRRSSGGAAVLIGPGCLMYAVVLSYHLRPELRELTVAHEFVLSRVAEAVKGATIRGTSDLAKGDRKIAGNSLRCKRDHFLYHGTILCDFPLAMIGKALRTPPRQPEYRAGRSHDDFVANCQISEATIRKQMARTWRAYERRTTWPQERVQHLIAERYADPGWTHSR